MRNAIEFATRPPKALREQRPFDEPVGAKPGDRGGDGIDQGRPARRRRRRARGQAVDNQKERHDDRDDGDLPDLDPDIEEGEGDEQRILRQPDVAQRAGESEAVDEAEEEGDPPTPLDPPVEEVLQGDGDDAGGVFADAVVARRAG